MKKKVSVIIPMHNTEKYIEECIQSALNQTYRDLEIIVVNDCSTDSSLKIVKKFKDKRIKIINLKENKGVSIARNRAIDLASGDYLCFLDSDDIWVQDKVEKQLEFMETNDYDFVYSNYTYYNGKALKTTNAPMKLTYEQAIKNTTIFVSTVMLNLKRIKKKDLYMPDLRIGQDTATWWQILKTGVIAYGMKDSLAYYRVSKKSLSSNKWRAVKGAWKIYSRENMGFFKRIYCFLCYIINAIKRRI